MKRTLALLLLLALLSAFSAAHAQDATPTPGAPAAALPAAYRMTGFTHIPQHWNNCGPATLTMGLTYFGVAADQDPAANWLKPNSEDKNVSAWQMAQYVNDFIPGVSALWRFNGTFDLIKTLMVSGYPVMIEMGYDPEPDRLGWMGHYLLLSGWDDGAQQFTAQDSYEGPNWIYPYADVERYWAHFNWKFIVLYPFEREADVLALLGTDADVRQNAVNALERARAIAIADPTNAFAWFNMGTSLVALEMFAEASAAYDQARGLLLPWRMLWYQFGPYEAYNAIGRYGDTIALAQGVLNDGGGQYVEETYYYAGVAREGLGELDRAISNYRAAVQFNPNFTPAVDALRRLGA